MTPRRNFIKTAIAAAPSAPLLAAPEKRGPNDRIRVALVGLRGRGKDHVRALQELSSEGIDLVTMCDVDQKLLAARSADYEKLSGTKLITTTDMRRVFDDKDIDAVCFATPNHWHALGTIWACQAGKDVYCEKPGTHSFAEGPLVMAAAKKYSRIVAHGTQNRSSPNIVEAIRKLHEGVIGRVYIARGVAYKYRGAIPKEVASPIPEGLNWDAWQGPARAVPYSKGRQGTSGNGWHLFWEYGNGEIGNQGVHELDIIRWGLKLDEHPSKVASFGGAFVHADAQPTPQVQSMNYEYAGRDLLVSFETRGGYTNTEAGMGAEYPFLDKVNVVGVIFIGTQGYMIIPDYTSYYTFLGPKREKGPSAVGAGDIANTPHFRNFFQAMRARDPKLLTAGPEDLHKSCALAHYANASLRSGRTLYIDPASGQLKGDKAAEAYLHDTYRAPYSMPKI